MKYFLFFVVLFFVVSASFGQVGSGITLCGASDHDAALHNTHEVDYSAFITSSVFAASRPVVITLPLVVHIIHDNGLENITDEQVNQGVAWLNDAMRNRGVYYHPEGHDMGIEFCLASRHKDGTAFNGIVRYQSPHTNMAIASEIERNTMLSANNWDIDNYINIRLVRTVCVDNVCNIGGYAGPGRGPVMRADHFGSFEDGIKVAVHELAHYFFIWHTFLNGCRNDNCITDGDRVCDTPPDNTKESHCNIPLNTCLTDEDDLSDNNPFRPIDIGGIGDQADQHTNYMDYGACRNHFTVGQGQRMMFFLHRYYGALLDSKSCYPSCAEQVTADFNLTHDSINVGTIFTPITLATIGQSYSWYLDDSLISTSYTPDIQISETGIYVLKLIVTPLNAACDKSITTKTIHVICPLEPCYSYIVTNDTLRWTSCVPTHVRDTIIVKDKNNVVIHQSKLPSSFMILPSAGNYTICQHISNDTCLLISCHAVSYRLLSTEVCDNGLDDDGDGFVDGFDTDCPCIDSVYYSVCPASCAYIPSSFPDLEMMLKWKSDVIGSSYSNLLTFNKDGNQFVVVKKNTGNPNNFVPLDNSNHIVVLDAFSGTTMDDIQFTNGFQPNLTPLPIAMFSTNDKFCIFSSSYDSIYLFDIQGSSIWKKARDFFGRSSPNVTDFNSDGIPELYLSNKIISVQNGITIAGDVILKGGNAPYQGFPPGQIQANLFSHANSVAADLLPSPGLELAAGNVVYEVILTNNTSSVGNKLISHVADASVKDGITSVGDIDGDGLLDVIVVRNAYYIDGGGIWVWNPRTGAMIAEAPSGESGSVAFIGDVDGICGPEIGVVFARELRMYRYNGTTTLELMYSIPTTDNSGFTGITMFDFNQDGLNELVYRDETTLSIIDGTTGLTMVSTPMLSGTGMEYPIVADIDGDGQAEILTTGYMPGEKEEDARVYCFESSGQPWAPARSIWNQYGYNPTFVNDDLTIPKQPQDMAKNFAVENCARKTCPQPYNNFMTQATSRTQDGCLVWPSLPDYSIHATASCTSDSVSICFIVQGLRDTISEVEISCYGGGFNTLPTEPTFRAPLETSIIKNQDTFCMIIDRSYDFDSMTIVINDDGYRGFAPSDPYKFLMDKLECRYDNNIFVLALPYSEKVLDLGPDINECTGKVVTLNAGDFNTYLWSDLSIDSTFTTGDQGTYWVETSDICGKINRDSVIIGISPAFVIDLGKDQLVCPSEDLTISYTEPYDQIFWSPLERMSCDTCQTTNILGKDETNISILVIKDGCISMDTLHVKYVDIEDVNLGIDRLFCPGILDSFSITGQYDSLNWSPSAAVICDSCFSTKMLMPLPLTLSVTAYIDGCKTHDTISIDYIKRIEYTKMIHLCDGASFTYGENTWTQAGIYSYVVGDCDSLITLEIQTHNSTIEELITNICHGDSIFFDNSWIKEKGIYEQNYKTNFSCDSTVRLNLNVFPLQETEANITVCEGKSAIIHDKIQTSPGVYKEIFADLHGCDSTSTVTLFWTPLITWEDTIHICEGQNAFIHGVVRNTQGNYVETFVNSEGCDSISNIYLSISPFLINEFTYILCKGDTINFGGKIITNGGQYRDTIQIDNNCDEIRIYNVDEKMPSSSSMTKYLCPDSVITLENGQTISQPGYFSITGYMNEAGCDSTLLISVTQVPNPPNPFIKVDCENQQYVIIANPSEEWYYLNPLGFIIDTFIVPKNLENIVIPIGSIYSCNFDDLIFSLPSIPNTNDIPIIVDHQQSTESGVELNINLDPDQWNIKWVPSNLLSCDTCFQSIVSTSVDTTITILLTHISGCQFEQSFRVLRHPNLSFVLPNIINLSSTNGNDVWKWELPSGQILIDGAIFDRWGAKVYTSSHSSGISWDGYYNGQKVNQGVYVYILKVIDQDSRIQIIKGDLTVLR